jgi:hypothetical protein
MTSKRLILSLLLAGATGMLHAGERPSGPQDAAAPVPPLAYDSAFANYKADADPKPADWKQTNAAVTTPQSGHGGHAAHAAHAGHDMSKMKTAPKPDAAPAADPHAGHKH